MRIRVQTYFKNWHFIVPLILSNSQLTVIFKVHQTDQLTHQKTDQSCQKVISGDHKDELGDRRGESGETKGHSNFAVENGEMMGWVGELSAD